MKDWNVVVSVFQDGFRRAVHALARLGPLARSPYHNVLVMAVEDPLALLEAVERLTEDNPALYDAISRVAPAMACFEFQSADEFRERARETLLGWAPRLAGRSFHVRLHRRGFRHDLRSQDIERFLDDVLLDALNQAGTPGSLSFTDPDAVIAIDTIDERVGLACWSREDLARHRLLRPG
ncbi:MAG TPA: THUMP domain-containing protein [Xanthobacteraceae bacterium]